MQAQHKPAGGAGAAFGDFADYWVPGPRCPNCLDPGEHYPLQPWRHWVSEGFIDGIQHGDWTCERAADDELEAAGYLLRLHPVAETASRPQEITPPVR